MRKKRSDSKEVQAQMLTSVAKAPDHVHLRESDIPFWNSIVRAREAMSWNDTDLEMAANLARCKSDIERLQTEIDSEGDIVINAKGTQIENPKHGLLEKLSRRAVALSRMLHVHAEATVGKSEKQVSRYKAQQEAYKAQKEMENSLIAPPVH